MARRPTTRSMCAGLLVFSTSKNIAWRVAGRRRSGPDGGTRAANTGSGVTRDSAGPGSGSATGNDTGISGLAATTAAETAAFAVRRRRLRAVVVRSMAASYGTRRRPARRETGVAAESIDEEDTGGVPLGMPTNLSVAPARRPATGRRGPRDH